MGSLGAHCNRVFTEKPRDLEKEEWDNIRVGQLCMSSGLFANWKASLMKFCKDTKRCSYEEEDAIEEVGKRLQGIIDNTNEGMLKQNAN